MTFYATIDTQNGYINEDADIRAFDTEIDAREYLTSAFDLDADQQLSIEPGRFGDCWIKSHADRQPTAADLKLWAAPFPIYDVNIQTPGHHPGGGAYWITPVPPVLVAVITDNAD